MLSRHEELEEENRLAGLREVYYQGLRQEQAQVRALRHDMRNHLSALLGLLERGSWGGGGAVSAAAGRFPSPHRTQALLR